MELILKDRLLESLVEKLCHRLRGAADERQSVDLSYCLTLIHHSDRTVQKLVDNIACYADKLSIPAVRRNFTTIIIAAKKQPKVNKVKMFRLIQRLSHTFLRAAHRRHQRALSNYSRTR